MNTVVRTVLSALAGILPLLLAPPAITADPAAAPASEDSGQAPETEELLVTLEVPLLSPLFARTPVAVVNEEPITFRELTKRISSIHAGREEQATSARKNYANLLERVITTQLIVQEARNIGLDELPEIEEKIEDYSTRLLVNRVMRDPLQSVEPDPAEVDALYAQMAREALLSALTFKREEDALAFQDQFEATGDFPGLARRFVEEGRAEGDTDEPQYMRAQDLLPRIAGAAFTMDPNSLSQIFSTKEGYLVFYLYEFRAYEDPALEEEAQRTLATPLREQKAKEFIDGLISENSTVDQGLLESVDLERQTVGPFWSREERPADFDALLKDERVLATIHDEEPFVITVGDLVTEISKRRFHSMETGVETGKLNKEKAPVLRDMLFRRIGRMVAIRQGFDQSPEYLDSLAEFTNSLLFDTFINKVVAPDVTITEEEARAYFADHQSDFSSPTMLRMTGLAFYQRTDAENALAKLRKGADFKWVSANSPGQIDKEKERAFLFEKSLLSATSLPEDLQAATEGADAGDALIYESTDGFHHVILIEKVFPSQPKPYESVRQTIAGILFEQKLRDLVDDWSGKLSEAYETRIFLKGFDH